MRPVLLRTRKGSHSFEVRVREAAEGLSVPKVTGKIVIFFVFPRSTLFHDENRLRRCDQGRSLRAVPCVFSCKLSSKRALFPFFQSVRLNRALTLVTAVSDLFYLLTPPPGLYGASELTRVADCR